MLGSLIFHPSTYHVSFQTSCPTNIILTPRFAIALHFYHCKCLFCVFVCLYNDTESISNYTITKALESTTGLKLAKGFISGPSARRTKDLLRLNRDQLRWVVGLLTGHCHLKGHLFKLGLTDDPACERCLQEDESTTHILCDFEVIAYLRFRHLGQLFMESSDYYDAPP
jgi:hypothetical protein